MANVTRRIGLSLGADLCWPACYEEILKRLKLSIPVDGDAVSFETERVTIEPFDLSQPVKYDLIIDRLTHWLPITREWIKKAVVMNGAYVLNNPFAIQAMEKNTTYVAMMHLGLPVPPTWMIPNKQHKYHADLQVTLNRYARLFDLGEVGEKVGYPLFMKPYDGGGWQGVSKIDNEQELRVAYEKSGEYLMLLQKAITPFDLFVRCVGVGPQVNVIKYNPDAPLHDRYTVAFNFVDAEEWSLLTDMTLTINTFFGWDFNSCEALRKDGMFYPIDFANACPDSQVTSLHYHFPWLVKAIMRWTIFCAATRRQMPRMLDWQPFYDIQQQDLPFREKLRAYADLGRKRLEADRFEEFCQKHLAHLDEAAWEFFGSDRAKEIVRAKTAALYPAHEVEQFTEHFFGMVGFWRKTESDRLALGKS
ncbi:MAG: hypothetical protein GMKNLPBB_01336 [Myxococcota bacterium]|nr:hypothetical protein [Myxococcota bacterium]